MTTPTPRTDEIARRICDAHGYVNEVTSAHMLLTMSELERDLAAAREECERLRKALQEIDRNDLSSAGNIARAALAAKEPS